MMNSEPPASPGFLGSLRALGDSLLGGIQDRIRLVGCELQEEKHRLIQIIFWIAAIAFTAAMSLSFISIALVYLFWESARLAVLGTLALVYTGAFVAICVAFRRYLARQPESFASTLQEFDRDRACIRDEK
jgi:uncharacterized membrane protein YqjE